MTSQSTISLDLNTSTLFKPVDDEVLHITHGDLSQLGLTRGTLKSGLQIPLVDNVILHFPASAKSSLWKNFFTLPDDVQPDVGIKLEINTQALGVSRIGGTSETQAAAIAALQEALDPTVILTHKDVMKTDRMKQVIANLKTRESLSFQVVTSFLNSDIPTNEQLRSYMIASDFIEDSGTTDAPGWHFDESKWDNVDYGATINIGNLISHAPESVMRAYKVVEFLKMYEQLKDEESLGDHPLIADAYSTARAEMLAKSFRAPQVIADMYAKSSHGDIVRVVASYGKAEQWTVVPLKSTSEALTMIGELAFYFLSFKQIVPTTVERAHEFALARMLVLRHGLFHDSKELEKVRVTDVLVVDGAELKTFIGNFTKPEKGYAGLYASIISFLKSGHHATAANLDNTLMKVLGAIGHTVSIDYVRSMIPTAVYNGPHVASMRLAYGYLLHKNATEKISSAISMRLFPNPPGAASYCNLEIFVNALQSARFFEVLDRMDEYNSFKTQIKEVRRTMWYVAPYAYYLYNKASPDPVAIKQELSKLAGYAVALSSALPNSSLAMSPALLKLANENGRNTFSASLLVNAYVSGFTRFFRHSIESKMAKSYGVDRRQITL